MATRNEFTELFQKDMYGYFFESYDQLPTVYDKIFDVKRSNTAFEKETVAVGMGALSELAEDAPIVYSNPIEGFTVSCKMREFGDGFKLSANFVADTPPEKISNVVMELAGTWQEKVIQGKETFAARFFNEGGFTAGSSVFNNSLGTLNNDPTGNLCYDGKPFFNLTGNRRKAYAHTTTYYNGLASALSSDNLQTAYTLMTGTNNRDERGGKIALMPDVLVIPPALKFTADSILNSTAIISASAEKGDKNVAEGLVKPIVWQYLTDADAWFLGKAKKGLVWYERQTPVIDVYIDDLTKAYHVDIRTRYGAVMKNWRYWVGSNFATS